MHGLNVIGSEVISGKGKESYNWWYIQLKHSRTANCITKLYVDQPGLESHHSNVGNSAVSVERLAKCFKDKNPLIRSSFGNVMNYNWLLKFGLIPRKIHILSAEIVKFLTDVIKRILNLGTREVFWEFKATTHFPTDYFGNILNRSVSSVWHQRLPIMKFDITFESGAKV